jgi:type 1 fimbria pilin
MKRFTAVALSLMVAAYALPVAAHEGHHVPGEKVVTKTITGEVVDTGCYLGHASRGEKHVSCATKCLQQGMPMGLLTSNGTLYLVTLDHDNLDPYNSLKDMAGKTVSVTGEVMTRSGMKGIEASAVRVASK